jgi:hypothetical protein
MRLRGQEERMMRHWTARQENIYRKYVKLGKKITQTLNNQKGQSDNHYLSWAIITDEGIWRLPIAKKYGGVGLSWDESVIAIEGLAVTYRNHKFISSLITHLSALYLLLQYGSQTQKNLYLAKLMQGNGITIYINDSSKNLSNKLILEVDNKKINLTINKESTMFYEFVNFKKLVFGILISQAAFKMIEGYRESFSNINSIDHAVEKTKKCIESSKKEIYSVFNGLINKKNSDNNF